MGSEFQRVLNLRRGLQRALVCQYTIWEGPPLGHEMRLNSTFCIHLVVFFNLFLKCSVPMPVSKLLETSPYCGVTSALVLAIRNQLVIHVFDVVARELIITYLLITHHLRYVIKVWRHQVDSLIVQFIPHVICGQCIVNKPS